MRGQAGNAGRSVNPEAFDKNCVYAVEAVFSPCTDVAAFGFSLCRNGVPAGEPYAT